MQFVIGIFEDGKWWGVRLPQSPRSSPNGNKIISRRWSLRTRRGTIFDPRRGRTSVRPAFYGFHPRPGGSTFSETQTSPARRGLRPEGVERPLPAPSFPNGSDLVRRRLSMPSLAFRWLGDTAKGWGIGKHCRGCILADCHSMGGQIHMRRMAPGICPSKACSPA